MRRIAACAASSLLLACALAACGGGASSNGVASKSPEAILSAARAAIDGAKSAHISGRLLSAGSAATVDLSLVSGEGGKGVVAEGGTSFQLVVIHGEVYVKAPAAFWQHLVGASGAKVLQNRWLKGPASGRFTSLAKLTDLQTLAAIALSTRGKLERGAITTVGGKSAVGVRDPSAAATVYVATTGPAYPLEIVEGGSQGGRLVINDFNQSFSLVAPAKAAGATSAG